MSQEKSGDIHQGYGSAGLADFFMRAVAGRRAVYFRCRMQMRVKG
jgi:hypothetical protein